MEYLHHELAASFLIEKSFTSKMGHTTGDAEPSFTWCSNVIPVTYLARHFPYSTLEITTIEESAMLC